jgi:hypothetical protein
MLAAALTVGRATPASDVEPKRQLNTYGIKGKTG